MEADLSDDMLSDAPSDISLGEQHSINTVIFDIGMVLKGWHPQLEKFFGREAAAIVEDAIWGRGYWEEMDRGVADEEVLMNLMAAAAPEYEQQIRYILDHLELISERYDYAIPWVEELKEAGFQVYYLSNYSRRLREKVPQTIDFLPYMDGGVFSCDVKLMKPDQKIYQLLCEKYDLVPEHCLFIDDRQENVDAAVQFGMQAVRFDGYEKSYGRIMELLGF
ncbi:MAG: HAD family hydrolase [Lachnospiraceae bacterium]